MHELVESIRADGLSARRFRDATVVKVPAVHLEAFRAFNRKMCHADDLLPAFSVDMRYALLTRRSISRRSSHVHTHTRPSPCLRPADQDVNAVHV